MNNRAAGWRALGVIEGLLLARIVAQLFAARPDHPVLNALLALTAPLVAPFQFLDRWTNQPEWGARLDVAALAMLVALLAIALVIAKFVQKRAISDGEPNYVQSKRINR